VNNTELFKFVKNALERVYKHHGYLIKNRVHERSIVFWFGIYLYELLQHKEKKYAEYNLDFEYNKDHSNPKRTKNFQKGTYPDILLHKRDSNKYNLLIVEFKPWWRPDNSRDLMKLRDFTHPDGNYEYKYGLSIILGKDEPIITPLQKGEIINNE
jgi:hypothetical protein